MNADQQANRILDFGGFPGYWKIRKSTKETNGERFETYMKIEEPGEIHAFRTNASVEAINVHKPALRYEQEFTGVNPPQWLFKLLANFGCLLGYTLPK